DAPGYTQRARAGAEDAPHPAPLAEIAMVARPGFRFRGDEDSPVENHEKDKDARQFLHKQIAPLGRATRFDSDRHLSGDRAESLSLVATGQMHNRPLAQFGPRQRTSQAAFLHPHDPL